MQYMMLIYLDEAAAAARSASEIAAAVASHAPYIERLRANQRYASSARLAPARSARVLRASDGKPVVTHGPFAESREQLGGFYLIEAPDLDEAIDIARANPGLQTVATAIEIRPVLRGVAELPSTGEVQLARGAEIYSPGWIVLAEPGSATTVVRRDGALELVDGPFRDEAEPVRACRLVPAGSDVTPGAAAIEVRAIL